MNAARCLVHSCCDCGYSAVLSAMYFTSLAKFNVPLDLGIRIKAINLISY